jgi:hypothetical protein
MKKTIFSIFFLILVAINCYGNTESPWSEVTYSNNKKYVFVLVSNGSLSEYELKTRQSWEPLQLSSQELKDYEFGLSRNLQEENEIRRIYPNSGLYKVGNLTNPLWSVSPENTENWITRMDEKYVANDGTYVIGYNPHVAELSNGVPNKEEAGVFIYSSSFGSKSYKVSELTDEQDVFANSMHGYFWANKNLNIDEQHKIFSLIKQNQKGKLEFSINSGESLSNLPKKQSSCFGLIILISIVIKLCVLDITPFAFADCPKLYRETEG